MKTIGMIGGMSWESTAIYYRAANELVRERLGGLRSAKILLHSLDFQEISELQTAGRWDDAAKQICNSAQSLELAGADLILICTNTMHLLIEQVQSSVQIPVLHIADVAAKAVLDQRLSEVGLLGTAFTMEKSFYRDRIASHDIRVVVPDEEDRGIVHRAIFDELALGICSDSTRAQFRDIIARLVSEGAQGIILGCTEIELLVTQEDCPVPIFPTARLHIEAAVDLALS